jgi:hypothetical protein
MNKQIFQIYVANYKPYMTTTTMMMICHYKQNLIGSNDTNKTNSGASVRQRTIPIERPPLVGEVNANFSR